MSAERDMNILSGWMADFIWFRLMDEFSERFSDAIHVARELHPELRDKMDDDYDFLEDLSIETKKKIGELLCKD